MPPKRTHKKSRTGCRTCVARKVKCNEIHPVCTNCARRGIDCIWSSPNTSQSPSYVSPSPEAPLSLLPCSPAPLDLANLELLHQYMINTSETFANRTGTKEILQKLVPRFALSNAYLMHAILGLTALHLHNLYAHSPEQSAKYYTAAVTHHGSSVSSLLALSNTNPPETIFLTNCVLAMYDFASATSVYEPSALDPFGWFSLFRVLKRNLMWWSELTQGPLSPLLTIPPATQHFFPHPEIPKFPEYLLTLSDIHTPDLQELTDDPEAAEAYHDAVRILKQVWTYFQDPETQSSALFMWPFCVSDKFVSLLREKRPRALVILAHHCAILMLFQKGLWWSRHQGFHDFWKIERMLDHRWHRWLELPSIIALAQDMTDA